MPRTSGTSPYWVRRESGSKAASNLGRLSMALALSGSGSVKQSGTGTLSMGLTLNGHGVPNVPGTGALAMSLTLSGTGSVVVTTVQPARPVIVLVRRRKR